MVFVCHCSSLHPENIFLKGVNRNVANQVQVELFNKQADMWDRKRRKKTLDKKWRQKLLAEARGRILELAVGAGANFQFYDPTVTVTAVDFSPAMIEKARKAADEYNIQANFLVGDIEHVELPEETFDTVISTLSLCAYPNPLMVLERMNRWCAEDGRILLLEHGKCAFGPLAWIQNLMDPWQVRKIGCHANRDILGLVLQSPLQIEKHETRLLGAVHLIWARPGRKDV